jgi:putative ABC transport system permease protein
MVFMEAAALAAAGILAGLVPGAALTYVLSGLIFGVDPIDVRALGGATVILAVVAALASYLPARRAIQVDPVVALRADG